MTPQEASTASEKICRLAPVIPVLVVHDAAHARPLAKALVKGGLPVLEVTLRTPCALEAIAEMAKVEGGVVGFFSLEMSAEQLAARALDGDLTGLDVDLDCSSHFHQHISFSVPCCPRLTGAMFLLLHALQVHLGGSLR